MEQVNMVMGTEKSSRTKRRRTTIAVILLFFVIITACICGIPKAVLHYYSIKPTNNKKETDSKQTITPADKEAVTDLFIRLIRASLSENEGTNTICLPVNDYLLLTALAECTAEESRQEITTLLGTEDMNEIRDVAEYLYRNVRNSGVSCVPSISAWLNSDVCF